MPAAQAIAAVAADRSAAGARAAFRTAAFVGAKSKIAEEAKNKGSLK